jgi:hypothetical protein
MKQLILHSENLICSVSGNSEKELLDVTIDEIGRPYEDLYGFENRLWYASEQALIQGYLGLRMNLDLEDDTNVTSGVLEDCTVFDVKYTMKIIHLCDQVVVRKKGSTAFIMLKDRYGRIQ